MLDQRESCRIVAFARPPPCAHDADGDRVSHAPSILRDAVRVELRDGPLPDPTPPTEMSWRVSPGAIAMKAAGFVTLALVAVFFALARIDPVGVLATGATAVGIGVFMVRDLAAPVRVRADPDGVTVVTGFARRVRLPWSRIERVRVDERSRYGIRSTHLEIDAGESLHLFSATELSAPVEDVAEALDALRAGGAGPVEHGDG
jgi:hypothetical protein